MVDHPIERQPPATLLTALSGDTILIGTPEVRSPMNFNEWLESMVSKGFLMSIPHYIREIAESLTKEDVILINTARSHGKTMAIELARQFKNNSKIISLPATSKQIGNYEKLVNLWTYGDTKTPRDTCIFCKTKITNQKRITCQNCENELDETKRQIRGI